MLKITILIGVSGSGKTTWTTNTISENPKLVRVNRDNIREGLVGKLSQDYYKRKDVTTLEKQVTYIQNQQIRHLLNYGYNIVVDNTHLSKKYIDEILMEFNHLADIEIIIFPIKVEIAKKRVSKRDDKRVNWLRKLILGEKDYIVDTSYLDRQYSQFKELEKSLKDLYYPQINTSYTAPELAPSCIICDLDGTLCLYPQTKSAYDRDFENDECNNAVKEVLLNYQLAHPENPIFFFSGRLEKFRGQTLEFLQKNFPKEFSYSLVMRADKDQRKDDVIKGEMFDKYIRDKYFVKFCIDDRNQIVRYWNKLGIFVLNCNQNLKEF